MKGSLILYASSIPVTNASYPVVIHGLPDSIDNKVPTKVICVRAEYHDGSVTAALDKAKPREGEVVLNSIPMP